MEMIKCHLFQEYLTDENDFDKDCTDLKEFSVWVWGCVSFQKEFDRNCLRKF